MNRQWAPPKSGPLDPLRGSLRHTDYTPNSHGVLKCETEFGLKPSTFDFPSTGSWVNCPFLRNAAVYSKMPSYTRKPQQLINHSKEAGKIPHPCKELWRVATNVHDLEHSQEDPVSPRPTSALS